MAGQMGALLGREPLVIEKPCVVLEPAAFAGSSGTHGAMISKWLPTRFPSIGF
jgi:hypothetical protein